MEMSRHVSRLSRRQDAANQRRERKPTEKGGLQQTDTKYRRMNLLQQHASHKRKLIMAHTGSRRDSVGKVLAAQA